MVKRNSCGDALLNQSMFDRGSKQKTSTSFTTLSSILSTKQGSSKSNGCLKCAALKGGGLHAPPVDIGLLYLGMHASDAAALLELLSTSICSILTCPILALLFDLVSVMDLCLANLQLFDFGLVLLLLYDPLHCSRSSKSHPVCSIFVCAEPPSEMTISNLR